MHIYRLVSEHTIEENILKKSDQKRHLDFLAIQVGGWGVGGAGAGTGGGGGGKGGEEWLRRVLGVGCWGD